MRLIDRIRLRVRSFLHGSEVEQELDRELRFHLEEHVAELMRSGMSRSAAEATARRAFGGVEQIKESVRDTWHVRAIRDLGAGPPVRRAHAGESAGVHRWWPC